MGGLRPPIKKSLPQYPYRLFKAKYDKTQAKYDKTQLL